MLDETAAGGAASRDRRLRRADSGPLRADRRRHQRPRRFRDADEPLRPGWMKGLEVHAQMLAQQLDGRMRPPLPRWSLWLAAILLVARWARSPPPSSCRAGGSRCALLVQIAADRLAPLPAPRDGHRHARPARLRLGRRLAARLHRRRRGGARGRLGAAPLRPVGARQISAARRRRARSCAIPSSSRCTARRRRSTPCSPTSRASPSSATRSRRRRCRRCSTAIST